MAVCKLVFMLEHIKETPMNVFKTHFSILIKITVPGLKKITIVEVLKCSQPVHPLFWLQESCKQCYFSLIFHIYAGLVGKK